MKAARLQTRKQSYEREIARLADELKGHSFKQLLTEDLSIVTAAEVFNTDIWTIAYAVSKYQYYHKEEDVND